MAKTMLNSEENFIKLNIIKKLYVIMKQISILILVSFTFFVKNAFSADDYFFIRDIDIGLQYSSLKEYRGVIVYHDFQLAPVISFNFISDDIEFLGDSIGYKKFLYEDSLLFRTMLVDINVHPLFPNNPNAIPNNQNRNNSIQWSNRLEYYYPTYHGSYLGELDFEFDKDTFSHHGYFLALESKLKIFSYQNFEPNLFFSIGAGDRDNNTYYYGHNAHNFGLTNLEAGIDILLPAYVDRKYSLANIHYFKILGTQNQNASYAIRNNEGIIFTMNYTYNIY